MIPITVDGRAFEVEDGANLLAACLARGIVIPHLCHLGREHPAAGSCRLCFVEIGGRPVPACTVAVEAPLEAATATPAVRRLQRAALKLLLSAHRVDCRRCPANRRCELQRTARLLGVGLNAAPFERRLKTPEVDRSHPWLDHYPNRCVLCGRCIHACRGRHAQTVLTFARRGFETVVSHFGLAASAAAACRDCRACVAACPVAALLPRAEPPPGPA
jgi:predicted molibdopterin-dependent oxidoreductase YjgC